MVRLSFQGCADELFSNFFIFSCGQIYLEGYSMGSSVAEADTSLQWTLLVSCLVTATSAHLEVPHKMNVKPVASNHFQTSSYYFMAKFYAQSLHLPLKLEMRLIFFLLISMLSQVIYY